MKKFKSVLVVLISLALILTTSSVAFGQNNDKMEMFNKLGYTTDQINEVIDHPESKNSMFNNYKNKEVKQFINFGFTKEEVADFTEVDLAYLEDKNGEVIGVDEKYYRIAEGEKSVEVDKETALKEVKQYKEKNNVKKNGKVSKGMVTIASTQIGSDTEQLSWMKMTTVVIKDTSQSPTAYYFKNSFEWLIEPAWVLEDGIGISHHEYVTQIQDSEIFKYTYDRHTNNTNVAYIDTTSKYQWTADDKTTNGMAFDYDLLGWDYINGNKVIVQNSRGYMIFGVTLSNTNYTTGASYGHYTHSRMGMWGGISVGISLKNLAVTGAWEIDEMTDTGVSFTF